MLTLGVFLTMVPMPIIQLLGLTTILSTATYALAKSSKNNIGIKRKEKNALIRKIKTRELERLKQQELKVSNSKDEVFLKEMERHLKRHGSLERYKKDNKEDSVLKEAEEVLS